MRRVFFLAVFSGFALSSSAQNPTYRQKLYYTCKVWGFAKYFHSEISTCKVNWDSVLVNHLPAVKSSVTKNDFNNELISMLNAAGSMLIASSQYTDTIAPELKRNRDFSWFNDTMLRADVRVILDTIRNNFRPHPNCWVKLGSFGTYLDFPFDNLMTNTYFYNNFPDEEHRILYFFKYWNIIRFFNPCNYVLTDNIDSTLYNYVVPIASAQNYSGFVDSFKQVTSELNDTHAEAFTSTVNYSIPGIWGPYINLRYASNKYVVAKTIVGGVNRGDEITSVGGYSIKQMEDSLRPFISAGDTSVFRRFMCSYLLGGPVNTYVSFTLKDSLGNNNNKTVIRDVLYYDGWFDTYNPSDSLKNVKWRLWSCNVGYVNMGKLQVADVNAMYAALQNTSSIIFDVRHYPNGTLWDIADLIYPQVKNVAKFMLPYLDYPGSYYWYYDAIGQANNTNSYKGRIIVLFNQETQSHAEYTCMMLDGMPNVVKVGSQTAGADGNVSYFNLSKDISTGFTSLGVFYPNGDSTQRIGILPDSIVYPTQLGIRHGEDEVLKKALEIAGCLTSTQNGDTSQINAKLYPNPSEGLFTLETRLKEARLEVFNVLGEVVYRSPLLSSKTAIDLRDRSKGLYLCKIISQKGVVLTTYKFMIQ